MTKSIFITGCSSGIGYMAAKQLQLQGYQVIASCRDAQDVARLSQEGLTCIQLDLTSEASINQAVEQALKAPTIGFMHCLITEPMANRALWKTYPYKLCANSSKPIFLAGII